MARTGNPAQRRASLVEAALSLFQEKGLKETTVDDIVRAAGVAKGTFYLYFQSKDDLLNAIGARMVEEVIERLRFIAEDREASPVKQLLTLGRGLAELNIQANSDELYGAFHRPERHLVHEQLAGQVSLRLVPILERIIVAGVEQNLFVSENPTLSAWFVLGTFTALDQAAHTPSEMSHAIAELDRFLLRGLGFVGEVPNE